MSPRLARRKVPTGTRIWIEVSHTQYLAFEDGESSGCPSSFCERLAMTRPSKTHGHNLVAISSRHNPVSQEETASGTAVESSPSISYNYANDESLLWLCDLARDYESSTVPAAFPLQVPPLNLKLLEPPLSADKDLESLATLLGESDLGLKSVEASQSRQAPEPLEEPLRVASEQAAPCARDLRSSFPAREHCDPVMTSALTMHTVKCIPPPTKQQERPLKRHLSMDARPCSQGVAWSGHSQPASRQRNAFRLPRDSCQHSQQLCYNKEHRLCSALAPNT
jgi:hypothetical protein